MDPVSIQDDSGTATGFETSFTVTRSDRYEIRLVSPDGLANPRPGNYPIVALTDHDPVGRMLLPDGGDVNVVVPGARIPARITADDDFLTHKTLREELEGFLHDNGVFRDLPLYVDLLAAHVYAGYINDRGGQYLGNDALCGPALDRMMHTRRLLGLDAVDSESGRTRLKLIDGEAYFLGQPRHLSH